MRVRASDDDTCVTSDYRAYCAEVVELGRGDGGEEAPGNTKMLYSAVLSAAKRLPRARPWMRMRWFTFQVYGPF